MENKNVDDLIAMIDGFMAEGGGNYYDELPGLRRRQHGLQSSYPV